MVSNYTEELKTLIIKLYDINALKFGNFKMKIGLITPVYFDLRVIVSYPEVMQLCSNLLISYIKENHLQAEHICGVPYTALPLATLVAVAQRLPMLVRRKETKAYGTKKLIEGVYKEGDKCLIIEDVVTSGSSVLETVRDLVIEGLRVTDVVVMVDREQGGLNHIKSQGIRPHALFTLTFLMNILLEAGRVQEETVKEVKKFITSSQIKPDGTLVCTKKQIHSEFSRLKVPFDQRAGFAKCDLAKNLFELMARKKTNLCLAADLKSCEEILKLAEVCGPLICILKTHIDIVEDFNEDFPRQLQRLAEQYDFFIMEDRKFADIGNTVSLQYANGQFKIAHWAHFVTAHTLTGPSILQGLRAGLKNILAKRAIFLLSEISSVGNLLDDKYKSSTNEIATSTEYLDFVAGIVCQSSNCFDFPGIIQLTPGVNIDMCTDSLGQKYLSPEYVIQEKGADVAVVGRGIYQAKNVKQFATLYRDRLWQAYEERVGIKKNN